MCPSRGSGDITPESADVGSAAAMQGDGDEGRSPTATRRDDAE